MNVTVKKLLVSAEQLKDVKLLREAFNQLKESKQFNDASSLDVFVTCAEVALKLDCNEIGEWCLRHYFRKTPPNNEGLCRAYICQAQLLAPKDYNDQKNLELSGGFLIKAIQFAKKDKSHHYLIYNASVVYWSCARPFLYKTRMSLLTNSLSVVVANLEEIEDEDIAWRVHLMMSLQDCLLESKQLDASRTIATSALKLAVQYLLPDCKLTIKHSINVLSSADISAILQPSTELSLYYKILKLKETTPSHTNQKDEIETLSSMILNNGIHERNNNMFLQIKQQTELILDLLKVAVDIDERDIAKKCVQKLNNITMDSVFYIQFGMLNCELTLKMLKEENYSKSNIQIRLNCLDNLQIQLMSAYRIGEESLLQECCLSIWNACLPLLQNKLRHFVIKPLSMISQKFEEIDSLLSLVRCQIHFELAKCEADRNHIPAAISNLEKALSLDDEGKYRSRLDHYMHRLQLRSMLYKVPMRVEDQAARIIEQASSLIESNSSDKRSLYFSRAGNLLSPDLFNIAINHQQALLTDWKTHVDKIPEKIKHYKESVLKVENHVLCNAKDKERLHLWCDLAKAARKQEVWDVTRVACLFALKHDDEDLPVKPLKGSAQTKRSATPVEEKLSDEKKNCLQLMAEIHFLYAEALVDLLQSEGTNLLMEPALSFKQSSNKTFNKKSAHWDTYCGWLIEVSNDAFKHFQRAANIGTVLKQYWIVYNAAIYVWNYTKHLQNAGNYSLITPHLHPLFTILQKAGYVDNAAFLCDFSCAVAMGLIQPILPSGYYVEEKTPGKSASSHNENKRVVLKANKSRGRFGASSASSNHSATELKQAIVALEYALQTTSQKKHSVSVVVRYPVIRAWVLCKALANQSKSVFSHSFETTDQTMKAIMTVEALYLHANKIAEFHSLPSIPQIMKLIKQTTWNDNLLLLELWTKLGVLALKADEMESASACSDFALENTVCAKPMNNKRNREQISINEHRLLHHSYIVKGLSLHSNNNQKTHTIQCFVQAIRHAHQAKSYELLMGGIQYYWNSIQPLVTDPITRKTLLVVLKEILDYITELAKDDRKLLEDEEILSPDKILQHPRDNDITLRVALYGVLFQIYADQSNLEKGLSLLNEALNVLPLTSHRLLLFKHRVVAEAKLNIPLQLSMGRFQNSDPIILSDMWRRVAQHSADPQNRLEAYRNAIAVLPDECVYEKSDRIVEFAEFMFENMHPVAMVVEQFSRVLTLLTGSNDPDEAALRSIQDFQKIEALVCVLTRLSVTHGHCSEHYERYCLHAACLVENIWKNYLTEKPKKHHKMSEKDWYLCNIQDAAFSFRQPALLFCYLEMLCECLKSVYRHHECVYVNLLMCYLAGHVFKDHTLLVCARIKCFVLFEKLGFVQALEFQKRCLKDGYTFKELRTMNRSMGKHHNPLNSTTSYEESGDFLKPACTYLKIARYYINQCDYILAKDYVDEARFLGGRQCHVDYFQALICYGQREWGKAIAVLQKGSPLTIGDEIWLNRILLLADCLRSYSSTDSSFQTYSDDAGVCKAIDLLENAIASLKLETNARPFVVYAKNRLSLKLSEVIFAENRKLNKCADILVSALHYAETAAHELGALGYLSESLEAEFLKVEINGKMLSGLSDSNEQKHLLLKMLKSAGDINKRITQRFEKVPSSFVSLPLTNDLMTVKFCHIDVMRKILKLATDEAVVKRLADEKQTHIAKFIDNYIGAASVSTRLDEDWKKAVDIITVTATNEISLILRLCNSGSYFHTKGELMMGLLLGDLARLHTADSFHSWTIVQEEVFTNKSNLGSSSDLYISMVSQSQRYAMTSLQLALTGKFTDLVKAACSCILDHVGANDPELCVPILALYQSCVFSSRMRVVYGRVFNDPQISLSAALYHKQESGHLQHSVLLSNTSWYQRLLVMRSHKQLLQDLPFTITYVILQHDRKHLYAGVLKGDAKSGKKGHSSAFPFGHILHRVETDPGKLEALMQLCGEFRHLVRGEMLRKVFASYQRERKRSMMGNTDDNERALQSENKIADDKELKLKDAFENLVIAMETYLIDVLSLLEAAMSNENIENVVLLADTKLLSLPLEALNVFNKIHIKSLTRDFSLHMLYHRLNPQSNGSRVDGSAKKSNHGLPNVAKGNNKTSKAKKVDKKVDKKHTPCHFNVERENIIEDFSNFKYIIDPMNDTGANTLDDSLSPEVLLDEITATHRQKTCKWGGLKGSVGRPSMRDLQEHVTSSFLFHGYERLLAFIPPQLLAPLNLTECHLALLFDSAHSNSSTLRQGSLDALKSAIDLNLEDPVTTSAMLSLSGVACIVLNQWDTCLDMNNRRITSILNSLFVNGETIGEAVHDLTSPRRASPRVAGRMSKAGKGKRSNKNSRPSSKVERPSSKVESESEYTDGGFEKVVCFERFNTVVYGLPNFLEAV